VTAGASARGSGPLGIWGIIRDLAALSSKLQAIANNIRETDELTQMMKKMQGPLVNQLRELVRESETTLAQTNSQDPTLLARQKDTLDGLAGRYKLIASAALPLSEGAILLDVYKGNQGAKYLTPCLRRAPQDASIRNDDARDSEKQLTPRQREVLQLFAEGYPEFRS
jgi:DNA-binding NarL/FixJ family response regulator